MSTESLLLALLVVVTLILILAGIAIAFLVGSIRAMRSEQQAMRRALSNLDWTSVLSNLQSSGKEAVRILDVIDKRLQKLEALEKLQISQTQSQFKQQRPS